MTNLKDLNSWRNTFEVKHAVSVTWSVRNGKRTQECKDVHAVMHALRSWHPLSLAMVARPTDDVYRPAIFVPEIKSLLQKKNQKHSVIAIAIFLLFAVAMLIVTQPNHNRISIGAIAVFVVLALVRYFDTFVSLRSERDYEERSQFCFWVAKSTFIRRGYYLGASFLLVIGILQLALQNWLGGLTVLIENYGFMYAPVRDGEIWRVVVGPYFHSGFAHFFSNSLLLMLVGPICWAMIRNSCFAVFVLANIFGSIAQMYLGSAMFDSFLGVSAGIFALFGVIIGIGIFRKELLPSGIPLIFGAIFLISTVSTELISPHSATLSHFFGCFFGIIASWFLTRTSLSK